MTGRSPLQAILFDLDDTLICWEPAPDAKTIDPYRPYIAQTWSLARAGYPSFEASEDELVDAVDGVFAHVIKEAAAEMVCVPFDEVLQRGYDQLGLTLTGSAWSDLLDACRWGLNPRESLEPDVQDVLTALRQRGLKLGIISNAFLPGVMRSNELEALNILEYFDTVVTSGDARRFKPHREIFELALERLGCPASAAMMVGDSLRDDVRAAASAGLESVWYSPEGLDELGLEPTDDEVVIRRLSELLDLV